MGGPDLKLAQLLESVVRLSYDGDVRVGIGEDPRKIQNIVRAQHSHLWRIYKPMLTDLGIESDSSSASVQKDDVIIRLDASTQFQQRLFSQLPMKLQTRLGPCSSYQILENRELLRRTLRDIVRPASLQQTVKGVFTAGMTRSLS